MALLSMKFSLCKHNVRLGEKANIGSYNTLISSLIIKVLGVSLICDGCLTPFLIYILQNLSSSYAFVDHT